MEKRFVKYDKELQIEAYWFQGILQKIPAAFSRILCARVC